MKTISLDGTWDFLHTVPDRTVHPVEIRQIQVPGPWQAQFDDLRMKAGIGIYRRFVEIPRDSHDGRAFLCFGGVFHRTRAWVNNVPVGEYEGGFLPFRFEVTEQLVEGRNEIKVRVESPTDNPAAYPEAPLAEIPFGKQSWYGPLSGIWQPVTLEWRHVDHMDRIRLRPELSTGRVDVKLFFRDPLSEAAQIELTLEAPSNDPTPVSLTLDAPAGAEELPAFIQVTDPHPWSPDSPSLYKLKAVLMRRGKPIDEAIYNLGFRSIEARDGRLFLNGNPFYLRAALDQDYYPDSICTVPSVEFLENQFRKAKELGLNCLRTHIKAVDPRYYEVADRLGMLIWTELPNGGVATERSRARKEALLKGIVDRDGHHPSIIIWTIINENWGVDLVHNAEHRAWLKRTYLWLKSYDPSRLVVDNSPLAPSFHIQTDIADCHFYAAIPDSRANWDHFIEELAGRAAWLFSTAGDAVTTGQEPLMCSEFGNWGLPDPAELQDADGKEPWWFETGHDWGEGVMYAHGVENRFADWSLDRVFGSLREFAHAAQWQQYRALKYEIETMRAKPALAGYAITEFTDVHWESNGLLDMRRNRRVFHDEFRKINADTVILPRPDRFSGWSGDQVGVELAISHWADEALQNARMEVALDGAVEQVTLPLVEPGTVVQLGTRELTLPDLEVAAMATLRCKLFGAEGELVACNGVDIAVHPRSKPDKGQAPSAWSPEPQIQEALAALGHPIAQGLAEAELAVTRHHDAGIAEYVRSGGHLLLVPGEPMALHPFFPHWQNVRVVDRDGTLWQGDWASSFSWLDGSGPFARLPGGPLLSFAFESVLPRRVISGCNLLDFQARVHAGIVVGWVHKAAALIVERGYGKGRVVTATFQLFDRKICEDPTAYVLLQRLLALCMTPARPAGIEREEVDFDLLEDRASGSVLAPSLRRS